MAHGRDENGMRVPRRSWSVGGQFGSRTTTKKIWCGLLCGDAEEEKEEACASCFYFEN
jgi:hypothetical protein